MHYPLPLNFEENPEPRDLQLTIARLRKQLTAARDQKSGANAAYGSAMDSRIELGSLRSQLSRESKNRERGEANIFAMREQYEERLQQLQEKYDHDHAELKETRRRLCERWGTENAPRARARTRKPRCSCAPPACCRRSPEQAEETRALWERIAEQEDATLVRAPGRPAPQLPAGARRPGLRAPRRSEQQSRAQAQTAAHKRQLAQCRREHAQLALELEKAK